MQLTCNGHVMQVSRLWKGQTGVDLAVLGGCSKFLEQCCVQVTDIIEIS